MGNICSEETSTYVHDCAFLNEEIPQPEKVILPDVSGISTTDTSPEISSSEGLPPAKVAEHPRLQLYKEDQLKIKAPEIVNVSDERPAIVEDIIMMVSEPEEPQTKLHMRLMIFSLKQLFTTRLGELISSNFLKLAISNYDYTNVKALYDDGKINMRKIKYKLMQQEPVYEGHYVTGIVDNIEQLEIYIIVNYFYVVTYSSKSSVSRIMLPKLTKSSFHSISYLVRTYFRTYGTQMCQVNNIGWANVITIQRAKRSTLIEYLRMVRMPKITV